ncbi:hypothetical protein C6370_21655 [Bacillus atrophaeus]|uniref:hypothetical protein n=1 Tax=Bacillus atrophaeus TaxID=1452 RepID=UPI000D058455|nr:hypothetical protein [Bacillus atrophaeus]MBT2626437.1 hypothetical protein [Bacillus sp. ISL-32]MEC2310626.1 hypothetical protein [Bacillus atrophaeus]PSA88742.1 hypothetical protein C6370_21655 [Bacillus atrophaeus]
MSKDNSSKFIKAIQYITLIGIILLIIPSGFNAWYLNLVFILFGINISVRSAVLLKSGRKTEFAVTLVACLFCVGFGVFRMFS